jgi:AcrR family transcriptional regulator
MVDAAREHMRQAPAIRPWRNLAFMTTGPYGRRLYLYVLVAPVFEQHGYKGATVKALGHACHLSPASLYHYFGSKAEMATYPLRAPALTWENTHIEAEMDPLEQLREMLGMAVAMFPIWNLALRMHAEIHGQVDERVRATGYKQGEAIFGRLIFACARDMERPEAEALARDVLASLVGTAHTGLDEDVAAAQRERMISVLRAGLVPLHVDADRFDEAMAGATVVSG